LRIQWKVAVVEPVAGAGGVLVPPSGYLERLRAICDAHGLLLIFDEVITGFGRLGTPFAAQYFDVVPDMIAVAKGITSGCVPMGAVLTRTMITPQTAFGRYRTERARTRSTRLNTTMPRMTTRIGVMASRVEPDGRFT
jgi:adenosylmethionine-8-amino-7-oxononanoate aminotransferase